jgi:hypothetical protein
MAVMMGFAALYPSYGVLPFSRVGPALRADAQGDLEL